MMSFATLTLLLLASQLGLTFGQTNDRNIGKPGACPPALPIGICGDVCTTDEDCEGIGKCCYTSCGGTICSKPVTLPETVEKEGSCPTVPTGKWQCSPTCRTDGDCKNRKKCCQNRCGALTCQYPSMETVVNR